MSGFIGTNKVTYNGIIKKAFKDITNNASKKVLVYIGVCTVINLITVIVNLCL